MPLLEVLAVLFFGFIMILMLAYILIIGRLGWQFFMYNFPGRKKRGTHYLILGRDGRFKWVYGKFKSVWEWPDKTKSYISKKFDRISQSAEPLIFLVEGYPTNAMLAELLPPEEMSRLVNNIMKEIETTSRLEAELSDKKTFLMDKIIPVATLVLAGAGVLVGLAIMMNLTEISTEVTWAIDSLKELKPQIQTALETFQRQL